jgi:hypothetical protein
MLAFRRTAIGMEKKRPGKAVAFGDHGAASIGRVVGRNIASRVPGNRGDVGNAPAGWPLAAGDVGRRTGPVTSDVGQGSTSAFPARVVMGRIEAGRLALGLATRVTCQPVTATPFGHRSRNQQNDQRHGRADEAAQGGGRHGEGSGTVHDTFAGAGVTRGKHDSDRRRAAPPFSIDPALGEL